MVSVVSFPVSTSNSRFELFNGGNLCTCGGGRGGDMVQKRARKHIHEASLISLP